tara:strand:- start:264 stop:956 length:693 start_codon:yes stop_codon:yes gene_type:complete
MADTMTPLTPEETKKLQELVLRARSTMSEEDLIAMAEGDADLASATQEAEQLDAARAPEDAEQRAMSQALEERYARTGEGPEIQEPPEGADFVEPIPSEFPPEVQFLRRADRPPDGLNPNTPEPGTPEADDAAAEELSEMPSITEISQRLMPSPAMERMDMKEHMERPEPMEPMEKLPMAEEDVQSAHPYTPEFKAQFEKLLEIARRAQEKGRPAMNMPAPEKEGAEETE